MWPSGWPEAALRAAKIEPTDFNVRIMHLWERATPTQPWTNNPIGIPSAGYSAPRALGSPYAAFPTMEAFRKAFAKAAHQGHGEPLYSALGTSESLAELYRAIHALAWPANATETDYPSTILDEIEESARASLMSRTKAERKTVGGTVTTGDPAASARRQAAALHQAVSTHGFTPRAIQDISVRMK